MLAVGSVFIPINLTNFGVLNLKINREDVWTGYYRTMS